MSHTPDNDKKPIGIYLTLGGAWMMDSRLRGNDGVGSGVNRAQMNVSPYQKREKPLSVNSRAFKYGAVDGT